MQARIKESNKNQESYKERNKYLHQDQESFGQTPALNNIWARQIDKRRVKKCQISLSFLPSSQDICN